MSDTKNIILHLEDVQKKYGDKVVLDDIDFRVRENEFVTVVGPSGCGKSTLLRLILGQERATRGKILLDGHPVGSPSPERGVVYQRYSLFPHLTAIQNVLLGEKLSLGFMQFRSNKAKYIAEAEHFLERVKLKDHIHKYPHQLSGGQQQRVAIAQALIMNHRILMMDEPFGALDPFTREELQVFLIELWKERNMTNFFVTHDLEEALFLGTRIIVLSQYFSFDENTPAGQRGARIVYDREVPAETHNRNFKNTEQFAQYLREIRNDGFNPQHLQHVTDFNLTHKDSFQTLNKE